MSRGLDTEDDWKQNPWFKEHGEEYSDYTSFYVTIFFCTCFALTIIILNFVFCCCSPYKEYWRDPNTGNRFILPVWISSPKRQAPLTLEPELSNSQNQNQQ